MVSTATSEGAVRTGLERRKVACSDEMRARLFESSIQRMSPLARVTLALARPRQTLQYLLNWAGREWTLRRLWC